jgi:hypothetical protein
MRNGKSQAFMEIMYHRKKTIPAMSRLQILLLSACLTE